MKKIKLNSSRFLWIALMCLLIICSSWKTNQDNLVDTGIKVADLKCEYAINPMGMDIRTPQLSWCIESGERGVIQYAYQIIVSDSPENLSKNIGNIWNSSIVKSSKTTGVVYSGTNWKVGNGIIGR